MSVRALGASTPRIQSFPGVWCPSQPSAAPPLLCSWELFLRLTGSEQCFMLLAFSLESNAAVRMLQKALLTFLSLSPFFFFLPQLGRKTTGSSGLGSPGTLGSLVPCPTPHALTQHPAPRRACFLQQREVKGRWFYQINLTGKNAVSQPLGSHPAACVPSGFQAGGRLFFPPKPWLALRLTSRSAVWGMF